MGKHDSVPRIVAFATLGVVTTAQQLAAAVLSMPGEAEPPLVAEESLAVVAVVSARVVEGGLRDDIAARDRAATAVLDVPYLFHDYQVAEAVLSGDVKPGFAVNEIYERMNRKREFYLAHLEHGAFPTAELLTDKLELWMGRVSPPRTGSSPATRLRESGAVGLVAAHARILLAFCRRTLASGPPG